MTVLDDVLYLPIANISCSEAMEAGQFGEIPPDTCDFLQLFIYDNDQCGCERPANTTFVATPATAAPTPSPYPSCDICLGNGNIINNRTAGLDFGNGTTLQCGFVAEAGHEGLWSPELCTVLQNVSIPICDCGPPTDSSSGTAAPGDGNTTVPGDSEMSACYLCGGPNYQFTNPDAQLPVPFEFTSVFLQILGEDVQDPFACRNLEQVQDVELWSPLVCAFLQQTGGAVCGCALETTPAPAVSTVGLSGIGGVLTNSPTTPPVSRGELPTPPPSSGAIRLFSWRSAVLLTILSGILVAE